MIKYEVIIYWSDEDQAIIALVDAITELMEPTVPKKRRPIRFTPTDK